MVPGVRFMTAVAFGLSVAAGLGCHSDASYKLTWSFAGGEAASALTCARHGVFSISVVGSSEGGDREQIEAPCASGTLTDGLPSGTWSFDIKALDMAGRYRGDLLSAIGPAGAIADAADAGLADADGGVPADAAADGAGPADAAADVVVPADAAIDVVVPADAADVPAGAAFLSAMVGPQSIDKGTTATFAVVLTPLPTCADGVDNDCDGRVDLDDPSCQGDPRGNEGDTVNCHQPAAGGSGAP
jgi:hypothetical protein